MNLKPVPLRPELGGRLRNITKLKYWQMAIAEAVKNSMDAIAESGRAGRISIEIQRMQNLLSAGIGGAPVKSVIVRDNGVGFNAGNFRSFCTPDSLLKQNLGGKGLGRLACLQAFERIRVDSVFKDNGTWKQRKIVFQRDDPELVAGEVQSPGPDCSTEVHLENLRREYHSGASVSFDNLAEWLAEHFLPALVEKPSWLESLTLVDGKQELELTRVVEGGSQWTEKFIIRDSEFRVVCYSLTSGDNKGDMVRLVAGGRVVDANTRPLDFYIPHLESISEDQAHVVLIYSPYFDLHVNDARNGVSFAEEGDGLLMGVTAPEFREACGNACRKKLVRHIEKCNDKFKERIRLVVSKEAPYYKPLLMGFFDSKEFFNLSSGARDEEILSALDTYKRRDAVKLRQESRRIAKLKSQEEGYWESASKLANAIETQKKVALAEYVTLRKLVLERFAEILEADDDGKAHKESAIHNLIFPQRTDTESNPGTDHQLWILDERFESHVYLSSDKPLDGKKGDRPDLMIALDHPGAFSYEAAGAQGYQKMVLVEFKRSLQDLVNVPTDDLPHQQMMRYARQISQEKAVHLHSLRPIKVTSDARFYMYAICELPKALLDRLTETAGFTSSPTGDGAFLVTNNGRYYIEYISLPKLLEDSQARNSAFFRKLGLDT